MTQLDLNSVAQTKRAFPFGKISEHSPQIDWLESYLSLYNLTVSSNSLSFYCGTVEVNQQSIFSAAWVLQHGYCAWLPNNLGLFGHLIKHLTKDLTVVCFDLPGLGLYGESTFIDDFSDYTSTRTIINLCQQRFTSPLHGLGQSTGCYLIKTFT